MGAFPSAVDAIIPEFSFSEAEDREAERIQQQFVSRYPLSGLPSLTLEEYAIGLKRETFCWWLEVGTKFLASIIGSTAYKFIIYYSQKDKRWNFKSQFKNEQEAFEATKAGILKILDLAWYVENCFISTSHTNFFLSVAWIICAISCGNWGKKSIQTRH